MTTTQSKILKILYGSRLYGLDTPKSDWDYYVIYKASLHDIILQKDILSTTEDENNTQVKELRKFIQDAIKGQTYAIELLFAPRDKYAYSCGLWDTIVSNRDKLLSKNLKPFLAYAQNQARTYSYKVEQLKILNVLEQELCNFDDSERIYSIVNKISLNDSIRVVSDGKSYYLRVVNKNINFKLKVAHLKKALGKIKSIYGDRVSANLPIGYDPKAYSHALRLCYMLDELMTTKNISFPVINKDYLMKVKEGSEDISSIRKELGRILDKIDKNVNLLPDEPDVEFWNKFILDTYLLDTAV